MSFIERIIAAYYYYKGQHGNDVVMFRYNEHYHACFNDAKIVSDATGIELWDDPYITDVQIPVESIFDYVDELSSYGIRVVLIEYRNNYGDFDIPDVALINEEKFEDY